MIDAIYTARNVSLGDLLNNSGFDLGGDVLSYKGDVYVIAKLTDKLSKPTIKFQLDFPASSPLKNNSSFELFLKKIETDQNEMLKQVTWLIIFGSFSPYGTLATNGNFATSTLGLALLKATLTLGNVVSSYSRPRTGRAG